MSFKILAIFSVTKNIFRKKFYINIHNSDIHNNFLGLLGQKCTIILNDKKASKSFCPIILMLTT